MLRAGGLLSASVSAALLAGASLAAAGQDCEPETFLALDHVNVAVRDLGAASSAYRSMGFAIKPGRPHANGIENAHIKFPEGTEIELITSRRADDELSSWLLDRLEDGDGGAFAALTGGRLERAAAVLDGTGEPYLLAPGVLSFPVGHRWHRVFFGQRQRAASDRPEHFEHANGAHSLAAIWLGIDTAADEVALLELFDARPCREVPLGPAGSAGVIPLVGGELLLLAAPPARAGVVGVTVRVPSLERAQRLLGRATARRVGRSLFVPPAVAHGIWVELREKSFEK